MKSHKKQLDTVNKMESSTSTSAEQLTYEQLKSVFHIPMHEAAIALSVDLSDLKRRCRELKISRWPYYKKPKGVFKSSKTSFFHSFKLCKHQKRKYFYTMLTSIAKKKSPVKVDASCEHFPSLDKSPPAKLPSIQTLIEEISKPHAGNASYGFVPI